MNDFDDRDKARHRARGIGIKYGGELIRHEWGNPACTDPTGAIDTAREQTTVVLRSHYRTIKEDHPVYFDELVAEGLLGFELAVDAFKSHNVGLF
jgi:hypothetical protein